MTLLTYLPHLTHPKIIGHPKPLTYPNKIPQTSSNQPNPANLIMPLRFPCRARS